MVGVQMSERQKQFRAQYKSGIAPWYSGWVHLLSIFIPGISVVFYCIYKIENPLFLEFLFLLPIFILYNFVEWALHKHTMHRPVKVLKGLLKPVFNRHTNQHHQYFSSRRMSYDSNKEWRIVLFPPYALLIFVAMTTPVAVLIGSFLSPNAGYLFMMLTPLYYLNYEVFHLCCHVKENWFVRHCPLVNTIRRHHAAHHSLPIMMEKNMNLTYPIADWAMGTSDLNRGLFGHIFNGYEDKYVKAEYVSDQGSELDSIVIDVA